MAVATFAGCGKPSALSLMLTIVLLKPSTTPVVFGSFDDAKNLVETTFDGGPRPASSTGAATLFGSNSS
jgi:hypothetical protein